MRATQFAVLAFVALAGCNHQQNAAPTHITAAQSGVELTSGRLELPAVSGHPGVAYFTLSNQGQAPVTVSSVDVAGAYKAELHETSGTTMQPLPSLTIRAGGSVILAPGGKHVMVFSPQSSLSPGSTTILTVTFSDGSKLTTPLRIEFPGGMNDMAGMAM